MYIYNNSIQVLLKLIYCKKIIVFFLGGIEEDGYSSFKSLILLLYDL